MRILWLVNREPYDEEDKFGGIIVESWSGYLSIPPAGETIKGEFEPASL